MTAVDVFTYADQQVRRVTVDGETRIVVSDIAKILGYRDAANAARVLRDQHRGYSEVSTPSGTQSMLTTNLAGFNRLVIRSNASNAEAVQDWVTDEVMTAIAETGSYGSPIAPDLSSPAGILALAEQFTETARQLVAVTERAETAERFKDAIERSVGLAPRAFHKHYFPDVADKEFFDLLYKRGLLIDQRGKGTRRDNGTFRDGPQHGHPGFKGKPYFYVDSGVSQKTGYRYEQTYVRPGEPEIELVQLLTKWGLTPQTSTKELAHV
jgi:prophage antirepressor-like protein